MRQANPGPPRTRSTRRISGRAQQVHILDPYQRQQKLHEGTVCPQCGAAYHQGHWRWAPKAETTSEELCAAASLRFSIHGRSEVARRSRPRLAVWKFASCDGCQVRLLDCEDELLAVAEQLDIAYFPKASRRITRGPYDLSLVEGSITTPADGDRILRVRRLSRHLVTIGACATAGGIQALRNFADIRDFAASVYPHPEYLKILATSTSISAHVPVDFELRGCPIDKDQLLEVIKAFLIGRKPVIPGHSVCHECKLRGTVCVMVAHARPCLGPVTQSGCGAICPAYGRGCYGCFGPAETPNTGAIARKFAVLGMAERDIARVFRTFNAAAEAFRRESEAHGD